MDSPPGTRYFDAKLDDGVEETILPRQNKTGTHVRFPEPHNPEPRNTQKRDTRNTGRGWAKGKKGRGIEKRRRVTKPEMEAKYASLAAEYEEEKRNADARISDQSEIIANLENDKDRLQEQNTAQQALVAELEKKLVKTNKTIEQQKKLISQQEKALAGMAMKFALGDLDNTEIRPKVERD
ncbi:hypothetical protein G647_03496 [Cladophialophora carrionii CBS 160.54]|uniref:Uncharacterized protein n=1 Tax=Cladophialophora carrionii CBS 160.54 TaxID=1279043 RepID=V9DDU0_9EURO|nr:uncharacterized protein G647_03496 [Cladophialophora carrionii CBS 160.54]ETI24127.1 hypothetical protein G647_03496 [Cladophialophora carrionii CBS 160.54]